MRCFECKGMGHQCRDCPNRRLEKEKVARVANPQKVQQEWRKSPEKTLRQRAFEHCKEGVPKKADLCELGWSNREVIVLYLTYEDCEKKRCHVAEDRGQEVVKRKEQEELKKCRECSEKGKGKAVCPIKGKAQQSSTWARDLEGTAITNGHLLICNLILGYSKRLRKRGLDSDKRCC